MSSPHVPTSPRRPLMLVLTIVGIGFIACVFALLLWQPRQESLASVDSIPSEIQVVATAPGWVDAETGIQRLGVRTEGTVSSVDVREGQTVNKGDVLLQMDDEQTGIALQLSDVDIERHRDEQVDLDNQLRRAREELARIKPLVTAQVEPEDELRATAAHIAELQAQTDAAHLAERSAQLQRELLQERKKRQELYAPANGEILRVLTHSGDAVAPGTPLIWFVASGPLIVRAELDERLFNQVTVGMKAEVAPEYDDTKTYQARVLRIARAVGPVQTLPEVRTSAKDDRVVECVLSVDDNDLLIGQRVLVRVLGVH